MNFIPSKLSWKRICKAAVWRFEEISWKHRLNQGDEFRRFRSIHPELKPSIFWQIPVKRSGSLELCFFKVKLCSSLENKMFCPRCHDITQDDLKQLFSTCVKTSTSQKLLTFWENVKSIFVDNVYMCVYVII